MKIYLASKSKARQAILRNLGLRFIVKPANVKESQRYSVLNCRKIVKHNALLKAEAVAAGLKDGIVIGVDTVVVCGKRVYGKPESLKEARLMLKAFSKTPQSVLSGLAVVDARTKKRLVALESTKVYFNKISDKEISAYFKRISPLNMAGGFDIQGLGGIFIRRIRGCYYNVVGLPLAKLNLMLRDMGVSLL